MVAISRATPRTAPVSSVMSGVLRFMWGPTHLEARPVQTCAEVSQFPLTPGATGRATPRRQFPGQAGGRTSGCRGGTRSGSWIPPCRVLGAVLIYRDRIPAPDTPDTARECNKCRAGPVPTDCSPGGIPLASCFTAASARPRTGGMPNHDDVTSPWSGPQRCDIAVVVSAGAGGRAMGERGGARSGDAFDDGGVGHAAALAHGLQTVLNTFGRHAVDEGGHQPGAGPAERVADGDGAAARVEPVRVGAGLGQPGQRHRGERLVDLERADVADGQAGLLQRLEGGRDGRDRKSVV